MTATIPRPNQREHILDVALQLMSEQGSAAMSMRRLAKACGVQVAAIYHYFPSKEALLQSVVEERRYGSRLAEETPDIDPDSDLATRVRSVFDFFWSGMLDEEPVLRLLLGEGLRQQTVALPTGAALLEVFAAGVEEILRSAVPELEDHATATKVIAAQVFSGFIRHIFEPDLDVEKIAQEQADVVVSVVTPLAAARQA